MRILITGGAGFIGSNLARLMVETGNEVLVLDKLTYAGSIASLSDLIDSNMLHFDRLDIVDLHATRNAVLNFEPDAIMHLAAESHVDRSIDGPIDFVNTNIVGTFNLLQAALSYWAKLEPDASSEFRFLHVSTDEVFGSLGPEGLFSETTPYDPHSPYSATKAASDHLARAWHTTYGLPVLVTNCSNNYGPYQFPEKLIPVVILKALNGENIPVYGDGLNVRDWLHVQDHCKALKVVLTRGLPGESYNIGGNNELTNIDLIQEICAVLDELVPAVDGSKYSSLIRFVKDRPGHDRRYAIDASKMRQQLQWTPEFERRDGIRQTVQWYLENRNWWEQILDGSYRLQRMGQLETDLSETTKI